MTALNNGVSHSHLVFPDIYCNQGVLVPYYQESYEFSSVTIKI